MDFTKSDWFDLMAILGKSQDAQKLWACFQSYDTESQMQIWDLATHTWAVKMGRKALTAHG